MRRQSTSKLHISTLARRAGVTADTVRYYERLGVLSKPARAGNGYRVYSTTDLGRLLFVRRGKELGLPLEHTRELVVLAEEGACQPVRRRVAELLDGRGALLAGPAGNQVQPVERRPIGAGADGRQSAEIGQLVDFGIGVQGEIAERAEVAVAARDRQVRWAVLSRGAAPARAGAA